MKFELGRLVATRGVADMMEKNPQFSKDVTVAFVKYQKCDWGITCEEDAEMNNEAVKNGNDRILAVYQTSEGEIWIITEWDRSCTTILFPSEY